MFQVSIRLARTNQTHFFYCSSFEIGPATRFAAPKNASEVLLYGTRLMRGSFPDRDDAAECHETFDPVYIKTGRIVRGEWKAFEDMTSEDFDYILANMPNSEGP